MNRRWYDSNETTEKALSLLKDLDENSRRTLAGDLTAVVKQIKEMRQEEDETEDSDVSIGIERVLGLYKISNARRILFHYVGRISFSKSYGIFASTFKKKCLFAQR